MNKMLQQTGHSESVGGAPQPAGGLPTTGPALSDAAFAHIAAIAHREAGLFIAEGKAAMVRTRLARRLRALKIPDFESYCAYVEGGDGHDELGLMISALTTNVSHFFREDHHFTTLKKKILPSLLDKARHGDKLRIWSAGCSNGQEPYSIAMTLREANIPSGVDVRILATDIDPNVVAHGRAGLYPDSMTTGISEAQRDKYFQCEDGAGEVSWRAKPELQSLISFKVLNLLHQWPMHGKFDVIFCRNVVIYFDAPTQDRLWGRFANILKPDGWLFLGHSERVSHDAMKFFTSSGLTSYQRNGTGSVKPADIPPAPTRN